MLSLRRQGVGRIAYIDIDAHHPDGVEAAFADDTETLMVSVHEENRWPRTGALTDRGVGQVYNLPVPRGFHDDEMALVRDALILRAVADFRPEAIVLQCGADAVLEDPQSRDGAVEQCPLGDRRGHCCRSRRGSWRWAGAATIRGRWGGSGPGSGAPSPARRCRTACRPRPRRCCARLVWQGRTRMKVPPEPWVTTLRDPPRGGAIGEHVRARLAALTARLRAWV